MTLLPMDDRRVVAVEGTTYQMNFECAMPGCSDIRSLERHHLWRRSFLNGDHWWVLIPGRKEPVGNCVRLCNDHHQQITENRARIQWMGGNFYWFEPSSDTGAHALSWQPPGCDSETPGKKEAEHRHSSTCPTCGQLPKKEKIEGPKEEKRPRKAWAITVPVDQRENGAAVLDELLEGAREELAKAGLQYGEEGVAKYFVLSTSLALFVQYGVEVMQ